MKPLHSIKCIIPFTQLFINYRGYCHSCCAVWTVTGNIGRLKKQSIMDIWNGERIQYMRKAILENQMEKVCNFDYCPYAIENKDIKLDELKGDDYHNAIVEQIKLGKTKLDTAPYVLAVANSGKCNLKCIMCASNDKYIADIDGYDENLYTKQLPEILPGVSKLLLTGNGDPLFNKHARKFLQTLDPVKYPNLKIRITTNANLLTPKIWATIKHNNFDGIHVSVDAATKSTYEKVRINGNWDLLMNNLKMIRELKREKTFSWFVLSFVVLKTNYKEIKQFVEMGLELECDTILFQKDFSYVNLKENINLIHDKKVMIEIGQILQDPIFENWQVDTTLINECRPYASLKSNFWDKALTKIIATTFHYPLRSIYSLLKHAPFIIDASEFYKNNIKSKLSTNKTYKKKL